jgi:ribose/xylose/arabinose/galactoside ABC-type transport system permease subunit
MKSDWVALTIRRKEFKVQSQSVLRTRDWNWTLLQPWVIGGARLNGGTGSILGSMIGALIMAVLRNGSNQVGWPTYMQEIIIGIVIILAVGLDKLRQSRTTV